MNIQYKNPFSMSDRDRAKALKLLAGKRVFVHALDSVDGAETAARLLKSTVQQFGARLVGASDNDMNQDVFISIRKGAVLQFQFWVGEGPRSVEELAEPGVSLVEESTQEELPARALMAACHFLQKKQQGTPLPTLSSAALEASARGAGSCFVSTVCMGSSDHPSVLELREFRDQILLHSAVGRRVIDAYYAVGPRAANWLAGRRTARSIVRLTVVLPAAAIARRFTGGLNHGADKTGVR